MLTGGEGYWLPREAAERGTGSETKAGQHNILHNSVLDKLL